MKHNDIRVVSSDLNGTLVQQHTMMDMLRVCFPHMPQRYEKAKDAFTRQTAGELGMKQAFEIAGPLTKGLSLRNAIEYACLEMRFLNGFDAFVSKLFEKKVYFIINSTGYTVTTEVIKSLHGPEKIHGVICNRLLFGLRGDAEKTISEQELAALVRDYFQKDKTAPVYDEMLATGHIELGIRNEDEKARLLFQMTDPMNIPRSSVVHMGDTMGDSGGICGVAQNGGIGIAFNYNHALKTYLEKFLENENISGKIILTQPNGEAADLRKLSEMLFP